MTNAEWIRNLNDKELTNFLDTMCALGSCYYHPRAYDELDARHDLEDAINMDCENNGTYQWLHEEVKL